MATAASDCTGANQCRVRLRKEQTDSMTGTSTSTPTTVARVAPDISPKSEIAVATASSKKLLAPNQGAGRGDGMRDPEPAREAVDEPGVEIDLDEERDGDERHVGAAASQQ